ncbi:MAG: response regulator [Nitrososphaeraceae archaeon]
MLSKISTDIVNRRAKNHYPYPILDKDISFYDPDHGNNDPQQHYNSGSSFHPVRNLQNQESNSNTTDVESETKELSFLKKILVVDDDPDLTLTFKVGLEGYYHDDKIRFEIYTYNDPLLALTQFKPHFYDLLLTDIYMPDMNGFELCQKILELDVNVRVCFMSAAELNIQALREVYPSLSFGCYIKKPITMVQLVERLLAELD